MHWNLHSSNWIPSYVWEEKLVFLAAGFVYAFVRDPRDAGLEPLMILRSSKGCWTGAIEDTKKLPKCSTI